MNIFIIPCTSHTMSHPHVPNLFKKWWVKVVLALKNAIGLENQADTCLCILSCVSSIVGKRVAVTCYARLSCTRKLLQFTPTFYAMVPSSAILSLKETKHRPNPCLKHGDSKNALHGTWKNRTATNHYSSRILFMVSTLKHHETSLSFWDCVVSKPHPFKRMKVVSGITINYHPIFRHITKT